MTTSESIPNKQSNEAPSGNASRRKAKRREAGAIEAQDESFDEEPPALERVPHELRDGKPREKRKRKHEDEDIEGEYMKRLDREQERADAKRQKQQKHDGPLAPETTVKSADSDGEGDETEDPVDDAHMPPKHESLVSGEDAELDKANRTVFLSNVATTAITSKTAQRELKDHMSSFFEDLASKQQKKPKIESIRFRSTAYGLTSIPKKAAYVKKEVMDATTKSTNAYVVYSTAQAAREAARRLNATVVLERHLRVDSVAHPSAVDNRRCVFVGNLGFVDDDSQMKAAESGKEVRPSKTRQPGDVEEGLWRQFMKAGEVESVRVVRDKTTRVGKGFAYVQFKVCHSAMYDSES